MMLQKQRKKLLLNKVIAIKPILVFDNREGRLINTLICLPL